MESIWKYPNSEELKPVKPPSWKSAVTTKRERVCAAGEAPEFSAVPGGGSKAEGTEPNPLALVWDTAGLLCTGLLTLMPKSGDVELQMAPMLAAASIASTAWMLLGK